MSYPVQKEYLKKKRLIYYSDQTQTKINIKKLKKLMVFLIAGSIIGPAMAGPTGPFAKALDRSAEELDRATGDEQTTVGRTRRKDGG